MSFTVFSYNATVLLIQPNPTNGWTQPMSISGRLSYRHRLATLKFRNMSLELSAQARMLTEISQFGLDHICHVLE